MTLHPKQHTDILHNILRDIYENEEISAYLGFKGGTAAMIFYDLPRYSVDLDFDLLDSTKAQIVFEAIKTILENYGVIKKTHNGNYGMSFTLSYTSKVDNGYNIKVEINKKQLGSQYEKKIFIGTALKVMVLQDMIAHKMVAMHERIGKTNRDIFDVWYFLSKKWPINRTIIEQRTGTSYKLFLEKCIDELESKSVQRTILSGLGELLSAKQKEWVKSKLIKEVTFLLRLAHFHESSP